jgi:hypothetical protein
MIRITSAASSALSDSERSNIVNASWMVMADPLTDLLQFNAR